MQKERKKILMLSLCCCWFGAKGSKVKRVSSVNGVTGDGIGSLLVIDLVFEVFVCFYRLFLLIVKSFSQIHVSCVIRALKQSKRKVDKNIK